MKTIKAGTLPKFDISKADMDTLLKWYNENSGSSVVQKSFKDIETAREKCTELAGAIGDLKGTSSKGEGKKGKAAKAGKPAKKASKNDTKVNGKKAGEPKGEGERGRTSEYAGKKIHRALDKETGKPIANPRREGSFGHKSFSLIKDGMTYEDYIAAGGRATDLRWDVLHGFTVVK